MYPCQVSGQASQRVYLATQLFSNSVGKAMGLLLPRRQGQSETILTVDKWFDVLNSRVPFDARIKRSGFCVSSEAMTAQEATLCNMERLIKGTRKTTPRQPGGVHCARLLPFQLGMLLCMSAAFLSAATSTE